MEMDVASIESAFAVASSRDSWCEILIVAGTIVNLATLFVFRKSTSRLERGLLASATVTLFLGSVGQWRFGGQATHFADQLTQIANSKTDVLQSANLGLEAEVQPRRFLAGGFGVYPASIQMLRNTRARVVSYLGDVEGAILATAIARTPGLNINIQPCPMTLALKGALQFGVIVSGKNAGAVNAWADFLKHGDVTNVTTETLDIPKPDACPVFPVPDATIFVAAKPIAEQYTRPGP